MSLKSCTITLCLPDTWGKTFALTIIDCPGHCHFHDGTLASLRVSNGATLFVNAVDGLAMHSDMELRQILAEV
jgi:U5 small nuclear ribonucleoprotein component